MFKLRTFPFKWMRIVYNRPLKIARLVVNDLVRTRYSPVARRKAEPVWARNREVYDLNMI